MDFTEWGNDINTSGTELPMVSLRLCGDGFERRAKKKGRI
jgi:hypothetical protein